LIKANTSLKVTNRPISPIRLSYSLGCFHQFLLSQIGDRHDNFSEEPHRLVRGEG
jgi:hypothetical protein